MTNLVKYSELSVEIRALYEKLFRVIEHDALSLAQLKHSLELNAPRNTPGGLESIATVIVSLLLTNGASLRTAKTGQSPANWPILNSNLGPSELPGFIVGLMFAAGYDAETESWRLWLVI
jgi:hypothetical protein